eukprot:CAMPEP_0170567716 /NCGR_PEP_ID=MMETSP0211-20121228/80663_1 /TAXON_ID=311385 /ORGANISM="Pseudokeronopsis sp., Strain OXSARD2" /LENGTH=70 /DNA_ID=CAMNT_0010889267 /DNA_START=1095 /DNA_END=1307 /DNA_ORIENTATION=-
MRKNKDSQEYMFYKDDNRYEDYDSEIKESQEKDEVSGEAKANWNDEKMDMFKQYVESLIDSLKDHSAEGY